MNDRLRLMCALLLVTVGLVCFVYAVASWQGVDPSGQGPQNVPPVRENNINTNPLREPPADATPAKTVPADMTPATPVPDHATPADETPADRPPADEAPAEGAEAGMLTPSTTEASPPTAAAPGGPKKLPPAQKEALKLWLLAGLPLVFVVLMVIILVQRWLRPRPMPHAGPSDTTDLWQEAGKRFKLQ